MGDNMERVSMAKLWVVTDEYIDYYDRGAGAGRDKVHRFAKIDSEDFTEYEKTMATLRDALFMDYPVNLVLERRYVNEQWMDYVIRVETV